jgi:Fe-S cluster biogenesis protein NfuA/nitrite reductase/ring-hydroxylating ferredoxin subunit
LTAGTAEELVGLLVRMYGDGLERIIGRLDPEFVRGLAKDSVIAGLLSLHDLHPDDVETRVGQALDKVRPYLGSHAGGVEYLGIDGGGQVHLRLQGSCDGCPASSATVKMAIETAILEAAPEITGVAVENVEKDLLQIKPIRHEVTPSWISLEGPMPKVGDLVNQEVGGLMLLLAATGDNLYAYASRCPACDSILAEGSLEGSWLMCPGCARRFDLAAAGRGSEGHHRLGPVPLVTENGTTRVAIPEPVS